MDRVELAGENFKKGYNCAQAVVLAFYDLFDLDRNTALKIAEPFGGGMGRMRLTCGAVSGMFMLAGLYKSHAHAGDLEGRRDVYEVVRTLAERFREKNGSIICGELLGINQPKDQSSMPQERTKEYYQKRPCVGCVQDCAQIFETFMKENQENA